MKLNMAWKQGRMTTTDAAMIVMFISITIMMCVGMMSPKEKGIVRYVRIYMRDWMREHAGEVGLNVVEIGDHVEPDDGDSGIAGKC